VYGYAWLNEADWVLVVEAEAEATSNASFIGRPKTVLWVTAALFVVMGVLLLLWVKELVRKQVEQEEHEHELSNQLVHAARLASVGELAAGVAHEINNPLAIIAEEVGLMQDALDPELAEEGDEENVEEHLANIKEAVFRCRDITRKLLSFVRHSDIKLETHSVNEILNEVVVKMLGNELTLGNIEVVTRFDPSVPKLLTDRNRLVQVFVNLVKNALDAMPDGGTLTVSTGIVDGRVRVDVHDTGTGIRSDELKRIFQPFFTTKDPGKGTGLGLSVCVGIVEGLGGTRSASSSSGKGSTFTVEFPIDHVK
jgi:two-component system NtrC family sensor kinase